MFSKVIFSENQSYYFGKVRDVYTIGERIVLLASDRISAFDCILPREIPYKGQILNQLAQYFLESSGHIVPNWFEVSPHPRISLGKRCIPIPIEMVVRGYLAGHAARVYAEGGRQICGVSLPGGLREGDRLPQPIITPTTKAQAGHDRDISKAEILREGIVSEEIYEQMESATLALYRLGQEMAESRGLILVDTKYEFGIYHGVLHLMDELHTPDSSRYYIADTYQKLQSEGKRQIQLSKEFVREWLMLHGFSGQEGQKVPEMDDNFIEEVSSKYIRLFEILTGTKPHLVGGEEDTPKAWVDAVLPFI